MERLSKPELLREVDLALQGGGLDQVRLLLTQALAQWRSMDAAGAWLVLEGDSGFNELLKSGRAEVLVDYVIGMAHKKACVQCGTCCRTSSPTLYREDLDLIRPQGIPRQHLFTLRAGELAWSPRHKRLQSLDQELIKLAEDQSRACCFLDGANCRIYEHRPRQCRHLECWSEHHAGTLLEQARLTRRDLFRDDETALALIREYDLKLPAAQASQAFKQAADGGEDGSSHAMALEMLELDHRLRWGISQRYGYEAELLPLLLGRALRDWLPSYGLELMLDSNQHPRLKRK